MKKFKQEDALDIIKEMFRFIDVEFNREELENDPEWYLRHRWSEEEQKQFGKWLIKHLRTKFRQPKRIALEYVAWFILMYGFTTGGPCAKEWL